MNQLIDIVFKDKTWLKTHKSYLLLNTYQLLFTSTSLYCQLLIYVIEFKSSPGLQSLKTWIFWSFAWSRPSTGIQHCKDIALMVI